MGFHDDGDGNQSVTGEFVVAMRDLGYVLARLNRLEVSPTMVSFETSDALDLAKVTVGNVGRAATKVLEHVPPLEPPATESATETVIRGILHRDGDSSRWTPVVGRNLAVNLHATPDIGFGGNGYPDPVDAAAIPPRQFGALDQSRVRVGLVDTGMVAHRDLSGRWSHAGGRVIEPDHPNHAAGHGLFISGLITQRAPNCALETYGVLDENDGRASVWEVAKAIASLASSCDVINLSLSCFTTDDDPPFALRRAIERVGPDVVIVAAAGNHGNVPPSDILSPTSQSWPAAFDRVVAVTAHENGDVPPWSFRGPWVRLVAPGVNVTSCYLSGEVKIRYAANDSGAPVLTFGGYACWSGSSFAAANVTGAIAGLMETRRMTAPEALHELEQRVVGNADGIWAYQPS